MKMMKKEKKKKIKENWKEKRNKNKNIGPQYVLVATKTIFLTICYVMN